MKTQIKFNGNKNLVVIQTPLSSTTFTQVTCLMTDKELEEAKKERPDLIFRQATDLPTEEPQSEAALVPEDETKGITIRGMTLPHNLDEMINNLLKD
jgi:hypothetical protein